VGHRGLHLPCHFVGVASWLSLETFRRIKEIEVILFIVEATDHVIIVIRKLEGTVVNFVHIGLSLCFLGKGSFGEFLPSQLVLRVH
jgi:hypothetical protein